MSFVARDDDERKASWKDSKKPRRNASYFAFQR